MTKIEVEKKAVYKGHKDCIYTLEKGEDGSFFSSGGDGMVARWNLERPDQGELLVKVPRSVYALELVPDTRLLLIGQNFAGVHLIDLESRKEALSAAVTKSAIFDIKAYERRAYLGTGDGEVIVLTLPDLKTERRIKVSAKSVRTIAINPYKREIAFGSSDNRIRVYTLSDFTPLYSFEAHENSVFTLEYSKDYSMLLSGSRDARLKAWEADKDYRLMETVVAHMYAINHIAFREDGAYFATCSMDKSIKIWRYEDLRLVKVIDKARHAGHGTSVNKLFWADSDQLISASDDRMISIWNIKNL